MTANPNDEAPDPLVIAIAVRSVQNWHDFEAVAVLLPDGLVGEGGEVDEDALDDALVRLARESPWLVKEREMPDALPVQASGGPVGSGRRRYGPPALDADSLRLKYPGL